MKRTAESIFGKQDQILALYGIKHKPIADYESAKKRYENTGFYFVETPVEHIKYFSGVSWSRGLQCYVNKKKMRNHEQVIPIRDVRIYRDYVKSMPLPTEILEDILRSLQWNHSRRLVAVSKFFYAFLFERLSMIGLELYYS